MTARSRPARSRPMRHRPALALAIAAVLVGHAAAAPPAALGQGAGSGASTVLRIPPAPRPLSLGNAGVALPDPWSLEYNPAAAPRAPVLAAAYQELPLGIPAGSVTFVNSGIGRWSWGFSARFVDYGEIEVIEPDPSLPVGRPTGATVQGGELTTLAAVSAGFGPVRVGVAGRWLRLEVAGLWDDAFAADVGVTLAAARWLDVGAAVQSLGTELEAGRPAPLPRTVRVGAAARRPMGPVRGLLAVEARSREARTGVGAGLELATGGPGIEAMGRVGYESRAAAGDAYSRFVFGGGVRVDRITVDLAYRALGPLGSTRQVGVAFRF
jgi:hypothetical protein